MTSKAAEILASALERDADAQESGELNNMEARIEITRREVLPINNIPRPIFKLALRFWKEWAHASRNSWRDHGVVSESDWPAFARTIASHVRLGTLPNDKVIIENFVRKRRALLWRDLKQLLEKSA